MPKKKKRSQKTVEDLLCDLIIIQLGMAGIPQKEIRAIVGVDMNRVAKIVKYFKKSKQ